MMKIENNDEDRKSQTNEIHLHFEMLIHAVV